MRSGIGPLDERLGGLRAGGAYIIAGVPGSGRLAAVLQFLAAGLEDDDRVALLAASSPQRVLEQGRHWGLELDKAWQDRRLRLLSFKPEFERRLLSAAEPGEAFEELERLLGDGIARLGIHPGTPLWESRAGTSAASHFVGWAESLPATIWATVASDLDDTLSPASEWVLQAASGVFHFERLSSGLHELQVRHVSPPAEVGGPITLEAVPGRGLVPPSGSPSRRRTDAAAGSEDRLALLRLAAALPPEVGAWTRSRYEVVEVDEALGLVERLQEGGAFGLVLVYAARERIDEAVQACRVLRSLTPAPILVATDDRVRSGDRVRALDAGASDVLSGPLSIAELASRAERMQETGAGAARVRRPAAPGGAGEGVLDGPSFARAVRERLSRPKWSVFALVRLRGPGASGERVRGALVAEVRDREGDVVGVLDDGYAVVLQGARADQAKAFLDRLRRSLGGGLPGVEAETLSGLADRERIEAILAEANTTSRSAGF